MFSFFLEEFSSLFSSWIHQKYHISWLFQFTFSCVICYSSIAVITMDLYLNMTMGHCIVFPKWCPHVSGFAEFKIKHVKNHRLNSILDDSIVCFENEFLRCNIPGIWMKWVNLSGGWWIQFQKIENRIYQNRAIAFFLVVLFPQSNFAKPWYIFH